jgi:hypothetical protein
MIAEGPAAKLRSQANRPPHIWLEPANAQTLPMTVLYDAQGKEVWRYFGDRDWNDEESLKLIAEASTAPQG